MLGTFSPQLEPYTYLTPEDTTPSGMFARGSYSARTKVRRWPSLSIFSRVNCKFRVHTQALADTRRVCSCFDSSSTTTASATWRSTTPSTSAGSGRRRADDLGHTDRFRFKGRPFALGVATFQFPRESGPPVPSVCLPFSCVCSSCYWATFRRLRAPVCVNTPPCVGCPSFVLIVSFFVAAVRSVSVLLSLLLNCLTSPEQCPRRLCRSGSFRFEPFVVCSYGDGASKFAGQKRPRVIYYRPRDMIAGDRSPSTQ
jgi:hypothetical protein